jgi:tetratricopeptide (TPR) repeat protein
VSDPDVLALAQHALDLVGTDPRAALREADAVLGLIRPRVSPQAAATAQRAAGLALKQLGDLESAESRLRRGVRAAAGRSQRAEAEARMSLAFILLERGRVRGALRETERASEALSGLEAARLLGQRALILTRSGRTAEALEAYGRAIPVVQRAGDNLWEAGFRTNRGLLHAYGGSLPQAERDLLRARELRVRLEQPSLVADSDWNLGFVASLRGEVPQALDWYDRAEAAYVALGQVRPDLLVDRARTLLLVGLVEEAGMAVSSALQLLERNGSAAALPEALVLQAQVALACGDETLARAASAKAVRLFSRQDRPAWSLLARHTALRAQSVGPASAGIASRAMRLADELHVAGWHEEELDSLLIAATVSGARASSSTAALARVKSHRWRGSHALRLRVWHAEALQRAADGDRSSALRAVAAGLRVIDEQRALMGARELQTQVSAHGEALATLGLRLALSGRRPSGVLRQAERWRASSLRVRPARPPADVSLSGALADVRRLDRHQEESRLGGHLDRSQRAELIQAERRVRDLTRLASGERGRTGQTLDLGALTEVLGARALVEFVVLDQTLYAVTLVDGWSRTHRLGDTGPIGVEVEMLRFAMQRLASGGSDRLTHAVSTAAGRLDSLLVAPLPETAGRPLVLSPTGLLQSLPWGALPSLVGRSISVAPSATLWLDAARLPWSSGNPVLVGDTRLPEAAQEIEAIAALYPASVCLLGGEASVDSVLQHMDGASTVHISAHGSLRADNPMFSSLELADGPLTVYDLERLARLPRLVLMPACRSAVSAVRSGDELLGLAAAFLGLGTRAVVASVLPVADSDVARFMPRMHAMLVAGRAPADALADAAASTREATDWLVASSFVCLGAG